MANKCNAENKVFPIRFPHFDHLRRDMDLDYFNAVMSYFLTHFIICRSLNGVNSLPKFNT